MTTKKFTWKRRTGGARKAHKFAGESENPICGAVAAIGTPFAPVVELGPDSVPCGNVCQRCRLDRPNRRKRPVVQVPELEAFVAAGTARR